MERLRFSMELHDDISQRLAGISMLCKSYMQVPVPPSFMAELAAFIDETLVRIRQYARNTFPMEPDSPGLRESLETLCQRAARHTACDCVLTWQAPEKSPFNPAQELHIYRIVQEALQNAVQHGKASRIDVQVQSADGIFSVCVQDNGIGKSRSAEEQAGPDGTRQFIKKGGLGLRSIRYRAGQLGAECVFDTAGQGGARLEINIPLL